jgi:hypothetical protein
MSNSTVLVIALAALLRVGLFPFADNKHGDAPMRALVAERMNLEPASAANPRTYCQFGPLHTTLMRPFLALDHDAPRSSRYLSLLMGLALFFPFLRLARRLVGEQHAQLAAFALALSPLHLQVSTTAASEALYLVLFVAALERLLAAVERPRLGTFAVAGLLSSLAAVTRYDAWFAIPVAAAAVAVFARGRPVWRGLAVYCACAALLPVAWLVWGAAATDDAFFFAHYITGDHANLAATAVRRYGPALGRARQLGIWALSFTGAMTLPMLVGAALAARRLGRSLPAAMRIVIVTALVPPALYLAKGLLFLSFEPLPRFALVPGVLLLPLAASAVPLARARALRATVVATALGFSAAVMLVATVGRPRIWAGAESMGPLTRVDAEDRALADWLRAHRQPGERVMLEPLAFAEIGVAHLARVPMSESITLTVTREPRATVAASAAATGARWLAGYDQPGGWPRRLPDWPPDAMAFGRWRLIPVPPR